MTQEQLIAATIGNMYTMFISFIRLSILMFCVGILWCFLPKKTDHDIVKMTKTLGLTFGLFVAAIMFFIMVMAK